jgi:hypothetical protein
MLVGVLIGGKGDGSELYAERIGRLQDYIKYLAIALSRSHNTFFQIHFILTSTILSSAMVETNCSWAVPSQEIKVGPEQYSKYIEANTAISRF